MRILYKTYDSDNLICAEAAEVTEEPTYLRDLAENMCIKWEPIYEQFSVVMLTFREVTVDKEDLYLPSYALTLVPTSVIKSYMHTLLRDGYADLTEYDSFQGEDENLIFEKN